MAVIFDLDQTLIDSKKAEVFRNKRDWNSVYKLIPELVPYENISEIIQELNDHNVKIAIVTTAPRPYCEKIITHWRWKIHATVCFHDVSKRKPHPEQINLAIEQMGVKPNEVVSFGDRDIDIIASKNAGVTGVACLWGTDNKESLLNTKPDIILTTVNEMADYLRERFINN